MKEFKSEGIDKITGLLGEDVEDKVEILKELCSISKDYNSYSGISSDMDGSVKFIYITDGTEE